MDPSRMYVCICNAFTDKQVRRLLEEGTDTTAGVFRGIGCKPQCGKCVPTLRQMVGDHRAERACAEVEDFPDLAMPELLAAE